MTDLSSRSERKGEKKGDVTISTETIEKLFRYVVGVYIIHSFAMTQKHAEGLLKDLGEIEDKHGLT
jgi:hypothetical protein